MLFCLVFRGIDYAKYNIWEGGGEVFGKKLKGGRKRRKLQKKTGLGMREIHLIICPYLLLAAGTND